MQRETLYNLAGFKKKNLLKRYWCSAHRMHENNNSLWVSPQLSGWATNAHQINMVSRSSCCQNMSSHNPCLCQLMQMRRTCGAALWSVHSSTRTDTEPLSEHFKKKKKNLASCDSVTASIANNCRPVVAVNISLHWAYLFCQTLSQRHINSHMCRE